jgi:hypothetical protein
MEELERRIDELAEEIQRLQSDKGPLNEGEKGKAKMNETSVAQVTRPTPPEDRISFFACNAPLRLRLTAVWWGYEIAVQIM